MDEFEIPPLCRRIREARERVGLSQEEAARNLHLSLGGYAAYERSREPKPARAREIALAFGLPADYFERADQDASNGALGELLSLVRPGPETESLGPLTVDEIRGRFEGLAHIVREHGAGISAELRRLQQPPASPEEGPLLAELEGLRGDVAALSAELSRLVERLDPGSEDASL